MSKSKSRGANPFAARQATKVQLITDSVAFMIKLNDKASTRAGEQGPTFKAQAKVLAKMAELGKELESVTSKLPSDFAIKPITVLPKDIKEGGFVLVSADHRATYVGILDKVQVTKPLAVLKVGPGKQPMLLVSGPGGQFPIKRAHCEPTEAPAAPAAPAAQTAAA